VRAVEKLFDLVHIHGLSNAFHLIDLPAIIE
jgi:hypothetical protein